MHSETTEKLLTTIITVLAVLALYAMSWFVGFKTTTFAVLAAIIATELAPVVHE